MSRLHRPRIRPVERRSRPGRLPALRSPPRKPIGSGGGLPALSRLALETALDVGGLLCALGRCLRSRSPVPTRWDLTLCHVGTPRSLPLGDQAARDGREATGPARGVQSLLGVAGGRLRSRGSQSPNTCGVVTGDRVADLIGDRARGARPGPKRAESDDLLGSGNALQRPATAWAEVAGMARGVAVTPDAGVACQALEVRHGQRPRAARRRASAARDVRSSSRRRLELFGFEL
jgi:hypothetical protein